MENTLGSSSTVAPRRVLGRFTPSVRPTWTFFSGTEQAFPELDRAAYVDLPTTAERIVAEQQPLLDRLREDAGSNS